VNQEKQIKGKLKGDNESSKGGGAKDMNDDKE
jgi:hypothetical protein